VAVLWPATITETIYRRPKHNKWTSELHTMPKITT
jgi:hypothetical protein